MCEIGGGLKWPALFSFIRNIPNGSATRDELEPEYKGWGTVAKTNVILADIYDMLATINANMIAIASGRKGKRPKPYPRPWVKDESRQEQHFGRDPLPPGELREWFEQKRKEKHASSSKRDS